MKRTVRLGTCPSQTPIGRAALNPPESVQHGRPFGELGSILCGQSRVQGRDPPAFSARNAGESLITYSSIRRRVALGKTNSVPSRKVFPFVAQNSKCGCGAGVVHLLHAVPGVGVPYLGSGVHRLRAKEASLGPTATPSWALRGEELQSSRSRPGRSGITPPGFYGRGNPGKARQRNQYPAPPG